MTIQLGPILGAVSESEARIWFCATDAQCYRVDVRRAGSGRPVPGSPFRAASTGYGGATMAVARLPAPYAAYTYDVLDADGTSALPPDLEPPVFHSAPRPRTTGPLRFGVVSCNHMATEAYASADEREAMWRRLGTELARRDGALLLAVGDQAYCDEAFHAGGSRAFPPLLRRHYWKAYRTHWDWRAIRSVLSRTPTCMIWDDHEIRNGWGSAARDARSADRRARFRVAREIYRAYQHAHNPPPAAPFTRADLCYGFRYGDVGFLVLDLRGRRDVTRRRDPVLGAAQWRKIRAWLAREAPELGALFVVSSVPPIHVKSRLVELGSSFVTDLADQWTTDANLPELRRLVRLLLDCQNERDIPVVVLGGDVHVGAYAEIHSSRPEHARRPVLCQLTASPVSNQPVGDVLMSQIRGESFAVDDGLRATVRFACNERNFGLVALEPRRGRYRVSLELHREGHPRPRVYDLPL